MARTLRAPSLVASVLGALLFTAPVLAWAETTDAELEEDPSLEGPAAAPAPDRVARAFRLGASLGVAVPAGYLGYERPFRQFASEGASFGGAAELGISRSFALAAFGAYEAYGAPSACPDCTATGLVGGLGLVYHLAQGIAVDPWVRYGVGYRSAAVSVPEQQAAPLLGGPSSGTFRSLDVVSLAIGADYYPLPTFGLGIFAGLDVGRSFSRPLPDSGAGTSTLWTFGMRVAWAPGQVNLASEKRVGAR